MSNPASQMTGQLGGIFSVLAVGAVGGLIDARAAGLARREEWSSEVLFQQLDQAVKNAQGWAAYAKRLVSENEMLKAENARLRAVSRERQEMISHLTRNGKSA